MRPYATGRYGWEVVDDPKPEMRRSRVHAVMASLYVLTLAASLIYMLLYYTGGGWWDILLTEYDGKQRWQRYRLIWFVPAMYSVSLIAHWRSFFFSYSSKWDSARHEHGLFTMIRLRWVDFGISQALMMWTSSAVSGVYEFSTLLMISSSSIATQYTAFRAEWHVLNGHSDAALETLYVRWSMLFMQWAVNFSYFFFSLLDYDGDSMPVRTALTPTLFLFTLIHEEPLLRWVRQRKRENYNYYLFVDIWYAVMGFALKATMGVLIFLSTREEAPVVTR